MSEQDDRIKELQAELNEMPTPEATYAFNTNLSRKGLRGQFTIRAKHGEAGHAFVGRVNAMIEHLSAVGWSDGPPAVQAPPANPATIAPKPDATTGQGYEAHAVLMEVGESYKGNKPQLAFHCDGMEEPLKLTSKDTGTSSLIQMLGNVAGFLPEQLTKGKKYTCDYIIVWEYSKPDANGKQWKNIKQILPNGK